MPLFPCRTCGYNVSKTAVMCPSCGKKKPVRDDGLKKALLVLFSLLIFIGMIDSSKKPQTSAQSEISSPAPPARILAKNEKEIDRMAKAAVYPLTEDQYPRTFKVWGKDGIRRINALLPKAARKVAASPDCDAIIKITNPYQRECPCNLLLFVLHKISARVLCKMPTPFPELWRCLGPRRCTWWQGRISFSRGARGWPAFQ